MNSPFKPVSNPVLLWQSTNTSDILQKKMIYDFIVHYAEQRSELAIMTVNTLVKEACDNIDPMVRGLALKHLASLRSLTMVSNCPCKESMKVMIHMKEEVKIRVICLCRLVNRK